MFSRRVCLGFVFALNVYNNEGPDRGISEAGPDEDGCETAEAAQHGVGVSGWVIRLGEPYLLACVPAVCYGGGS